QAEDGIRDLIVTGVQTCALPISILRPVSNALPPRCAARYQLVRLIGSGAHGSVFLAQQSGLDRPVAVKMLHFELAHDAEAVERRSEERRVGKDGKTGVPGGRVKK